MASLSKSLEVSVPVRTAYDQWTQFEDFPKFMNGVLEVEQLDDRRLLWKAEIGGKVEEWIAEITQQTPDTRIAWRSISGAQNAGVVSFHKLSEGRTRVTLEIEYEPKTIAESFGAAVGIVAARVKEDLERFKSFIEGRAIETGAWRGEIGPQA